MTRAGALACAAMLLVAAALFSGCSKPVPAERATPKAAAKTLFQAMYDGNREQALACAVRNSSQDKCVDGMIKLCVGMRKASDAMGKRWGKNVEAAMGGPLDMARIEPAQIDAGTEQIDGDSATLKMKTMTMHFVRDPADRGWRADFVKAMGADEAAIIYAVPMFGAMGRAAEEVAREVDSGRFGSLLEAVGALKNRTNAAIESEKKRIIAELSRGRAG